MSENIKFKINVKIDPVFVKTNMINMTKDLKINRVIEQQALAADGTEDVTGELPCYSTKRTDCLCYYRDITICMIKNPHICIKDKKMNY